MLSSLAEQASEERNTPTETTGLDENEQLHKRLVDGFVGGLWPRSQ